MPPAAQHSQQPRVKLSAKTRPPSVKHSTLSVGERNRRRLAATICQPPSSDVNEAMTGSRNTRRKNTPTFLPITRVLRHPTDGGRAGEATARESTDRSVVSHDAVLSASTQIPQRGAYCLLVDLLEKVPSCSQRVYAERVTFCSHHLALCG